jgi:N-acyl-D-aspartate/D-glutamate deacylase
MASPFNFNVNTVFAELMSEGAEARREAYADPKWRRRVVEAFAEQKVMLPRWNTYTVDESPAHRELEGQSLEALALERGVSPFDMLLDLALDEPNLALRVRAPLANDDEDGVRALLTEEHCALGLSDAGAHVGQLCDAAQATDLLGNWVRDRNLMPVEKAVRKLTGQQADLYKFADRGYIQKGAWADVVVFDPDTVAPGPVRRVRDFPANADRLTADQPTGITHVLVNGIPIRIDGQTVTQAADQRPCQVVRPAAR